MEESENNSKNTGKGDKIDSGLYRALISHQTHQDRLLWSRVQLLIAVQAGVLVAGFSLREYWQGTIIMILGAVFTFGVYSLMLKDEADRDINQLLMDKLAERLVPKDIKNDLMEDLDNLIDKREKGKKLEDNEQKQLEILKYMKKENRYVFFTSSNILKLPKWVFKGRVIFRFTMKFFIVLDIILAILYALLALHIPLVKELFFPMP